MKKEIMKKEEGVYGECSSCGNKIWEHMTENKEYLDDFDMCGACVTGESAEYILATITNVNKEEELTNPYIKYEEK